ncbi:MAG: hypothetical protein RL227_248 [Pseudomonadota bacterium]|jgi:hypothetical protein
METRSTTATTADAFVSAEAPRSTAYLLANRLFADAPQHAEIIVKRRRLVLQGPAADESLDASARAGPATAPHDGNRAPRVFVVARDEAAASMPAEPTLPQPTHPGRRRVEPGRKPGKVVLIVPPRAGGAAPDAPMQAHAAEPTPADLDLLLSRVEEHRAVKAALARIKTLTADARAASKLRF